MSAALTNDAASRPAPRGPAVLLFRGRGLISAIIRWQTRGPYSHAALLYPGGEARGVDRGPLIIEAWPTPFPRGAVRKKRLRDWQGIDVFDVPSVLSWTPVFDFAEAQLGKPYDFLSVFRFLDRAAAPANDRWFCSELVAAALAAGGVRVLELIPPSNVSPTHLSWSPLLTLKK